MMGVGEDDLAMVGEDWNCDFGMLKGRGVYLSCGLLMRMR